MTARQLFINIVAVLRGYISDYCVFDTLSTEEAFINACKESSGGSDHNEVFDRLIEKHGFKMICCQIDSCNIEDDSVDTYMTISSSLEEFLLKLDEELAD